MNRILPLLLPALLAAPAPGCKSEGGGGPEVAFLLSALQEDGDRKDRRFFERKAEELGLDVVSLAAGSDGARQRAQVEDALARGAGVIVVQPTDGEAASSYVRAAHEADAEIVAYDRAIESAELDSYVAHDSRQIGVLQAEAALEATGGEGNFVLLSGPAGHSVAGEITRGYQDALRPYLDRGQVRIVAAQSHGAWSPEQALHTVEEALVRTGGEVDAVLAQSSGMARGAVQAVESAGLEDVFIAGADADATNVNFVCQGKQSVEVLKDVRPLAERAAEVAAELIDGEEVPADSTANLGGGQVPVTSVRVALVTADTVKEVVVDSGFLSADDLPACADKLAQRPQE